MSRWAWMTGWMLTLVAMLNAPGCQSDSGTAESEPAGARWGAGEIRGEVSSREWTVLAPGTSLNVRLVDVTRADARTELISEQTISQPRSVPVEFALKYDPAAINASRRYEVQARVEVNGRLRWINTTERPVLTGGAPGGRGDLVELWVERVSTR